MVITEKKIEEELGYTLCLLGAFYSLTPCANSFRFYKSNGVQFFLICYRPIKCLETKLVDS